MSKPGINTDWMDRKVDPGENFYLYAGGGYIRNARVPPGYSRWGSFYELRDLSLNRVHEIMRGLAARLSCESLTANECMIGSFFGAGMDEEEIEKLGVAPLQPAFEVIDEVKTKVDLANCLASLHTIGINAFFEFGAMPALDGSGQMIASLGQAGLGLPDRDYYLKQDEASIELRSKYAAHISRMLELLGESDCASKAQKVVSIESSLAQSSMPAERRRDPNNLNNLKPLRELYDKEGGVDFRCYFETIEAPAFESINVLHPEFFVGLDQLIEEASMKDLQTYLRWQLITATAPYLSKAYAEAHFDFYERTLRGIAEQSPRWRVVVDAVNSALGEAVGEIYVARYFPPEAKARVLSMVENGKTVMRKALESAQWLSVETREKQLAKLDRATFKIGYPDKWKDYSKLFVADCYVFNMLSAAFFHFSNELGKIGKPIDEQEWHMTPQTVNAYANPLLLEVVFPAAILQPPFFDPDADDAANYGGIMTIIEHEFGHFFDDQGAKFDADGKLNMQWTDADYARFMERIQLLRNQYSRFTVGPNKVQLKGELVSGEAAADLNGARLAFRALQIALETNGRHIDENGFTDEQRFFIAFGQIWASVITPEAAEMQAMTDPHPPAEFRANGTLAHMSEFAEAFGIADDAPMMLPPAERAHIW